MSKVALNALHLDAKAWQWDANPVFREPFMAAPAGESRGVWPCTVPLPHPLGYGSVVSHCRDFRGKAAGPQTEAGLH